MKVQKKLKLNSRSVDLFGIDLVNNQLKPNYSGFQQLRLSCDEHLKYYKQQYPNLNDSFIVVSSVGAIKTGKSSLLNDLIRVTDKFSVKDTPQVFKNGQTNQTCTKSINACPILISSQFGPVNCILIDTPGFDSLQCTQQIDKLIIFVVKIISTTIIYNSYGSLDSSLISRIAGFCRGSQQQTNQCKPNLVFLQKDFALQLIDQDKYPITAKKYLQSFLSNEDHNKNQILQNNFKKILCHVLPVKETQKRPVKKYYQKIQELMEMTISSTNSNNQKVSSFFQKLEAISGMMTQNSSITMKQFSKRFLSVKKTKFQQLIIELRQRTQKFVANAQIQFPLPQSLVEFKVQTFEQECLKIFKQFDLQSSKQYKQKLTKNLSKTLQILKQKNNNIISQKITTDAKTYINTIKLQNSGNNQSKQSERIDHVLMKMSPSLVQQKVKQYGRHLIEHYPFIQQHHVQSAYGIIYKQFYGSLYQQFSELSNSTVKSLYKNQNQLEHIKCELDRNVQTIQEMQRRTCILQSLLEQSKNQGQKLKQQKLKDLQIIGTKNSQILKLSTLLQIKGEQNNQIQKNNTQSKAKSVSESILHRTIKQKDTIIQNLKRQVEKTLETHKSQYSQIRAKLNSQGENIQIKSKFYKERNKELQLINKRYVDKVKKLQKQLEERTDSYEKIQQLKNKSEQKFQKLQKQTKKMLQQLNQSNQIKNKTIEEYSLKINKLQKQRMKHIEQSKNGEDQLKGLTSKLQSSIIQRKSFQNKYQNQILLLQNKSAYFEQNYNRLKEQIKQKQHTFENVLNQINQSRKKNRSISKNKSNSKQKCKGTPQKKSLLKDSIQKVSNLSMSKKIKSIQSKFDQKLEELQLQRSQILRKKKLCDKKEEVINKIQKCLQNELKSKKWNTIQKSTIFHRGGQQNFDQESSIMTTSKKYIHNKAYEKDALKDSNINYIQTEETLSNYINLKADTPCRRLF